MGRTKIKPVLTDKMMGDNPLTGIDFKVIVRKRLFNQKSKDGKSYPVEIELEHDRHVKIFIEADKRKAVALLSAPAKSLFLWVLYELESGKDYLWIDKHRYMKEMMINSINTYKTGMRELVMERILATSLTPDVFWINPQVFFCGSRINKYPKNLEEYVPEFKKKLKEEEQ